MYSGKPRSYEEIVTQYFLPELVYIWHLSKKPVPSDIESESIILYRAGQASNLIVGFQYNGFDPQLGKLVTACEAGRSSAYDNNWLIIHKIDFLL